MSGPISVLISIVAFFAQPKEDIRWVVFGYLSLVATVVSVACRLRALEEKQKTRLVLFFDQDNPHCVRDGGTQESFTRHFRIGVVVSGMERLEGCRGRLVNVEGNGSSGLDGNPILLTFALAEEEDSTSKKISPGTPEWLDVILLNAQGAATVCKKGSWPSHLPPFGKLFPGLGDYLLTIQVDGEKTSPIVGRFNLTLASDPAQSTMKDVTSRPASSARPER